MNAAMRDTLSKKLLRHAQLAFVMAIALTGLFLALPWWWIEQKSWSGRMLERRINHEQPVGKEALMRTWEDVRGLDQAFLPGSHMHLPGFVSHLVVLDERIPEGVRVEAAKTGERTLENALARSPADSLAWARLGWFRYMRNGPSPEVVSALRMSIYTAPGKNSLLFWRIHMAYLNREFWDADFERMVDRQKAFALRDSGDRLQEVVPGF